MTADEIDVDLLVRNVDAREAERRRDRGMALAAEAQERARHAWSQAAYETLIRLAQRQEFIHVDDLVPLCPPPEHPNAWGAVWQRALRTGVIERSGQMRASYQPQKHLHRYPVYRSRIFDARA